LTCGQKINLQFSRWEKMEAEFLISFNVFSVEEGERMAQFFLRNPQTSIIPIKISRFGSGKVVKRFDV